MMVRLTKAEHIRGGKDNIGSSLGPQALVRGKLWSHVEPGASSVQSGESRLLRQVFRQPEVSYLNTSVVHDENVGWLQVSVDNPEVVDERETLQQLTDNEERRKNSKLCVYFYLLVLELWERRYLTEQSLH